MDDDVFVAKTAAHYPSFLYHIDDELVDALRSLFFIWGKDPENPFKEWLNPGCCVGIKPNWVYHDNLNENDLDALVTHTSLIKHVIDLVAVALEGSGTILLIGDAPLQSCNFHALIKRTRISEVVDEVRRRYPGLNVTVEDWRLTTLEKTNAAQRHHSDYDSRISEDYEIVDLGTKSFLADISDYSDKFRVT